MKKALLLLSLLVLTVSLTACGGSSGSSDSTPASLTGAVVAAPISGMDIYIGSEYTTADQDLKIGVTNATGAIEFDKAVVAQIDEYPVVITTRGEAKNAKSKEAFDIQLSGIMMSATDSVYLTPFGTIAAELFEAKKRELGAEAAAAYAKDSVKDIVENTFGSSVNPFANPLENSDTLMAHEILTQSLLATIALTEGAANDEDHFDTRIGEIVTALTAGNTFAAATTVSNTVTTNSVATFLNNNKADIAARVAVTLTELTGNETADQITEKRRATELQMDVPSVKETIKVVAFAAETTDAKKYIPVSTPINFFVKIRTNGPENTPNANVSTTAMFKITGLPENGKLTEKDETEKLTVSDTEFASAATAQFTFTPSDDVEDYTFTFETIPAEGEKALTTTLKLSAKAANSVIPLTVKDNSTENLFKLLTGGTAVNTIDKGATLELAVADLSAEVTFDTITAATVAKNLVDAAMAVKFTAPEGFAFKEAGKDAAPSITLAMTGTNAVDNKATFAVPVSTYSLIVTKEGGVTANKLSFIIEAIAADGVTTTPEVPFRSDLDAKNVICANGMEEIVQSIALDSAAVTSEGVAPGTYTHLLNGSVVLKPTTWTTISGGDALELANTDLKAYVMTPTVVAGATRTTGFGLTADVKDLLAFDGTTATDAKITIASNNTVTFQKVKYTFAEDVKASDINFKYAPASKPEVETANVTVEKVAYAAPVEVALTAGNSAGAATTTIAAVTHHAADPIAAVGTYIVTVTSAEAVVDLDALKTGWVAAITAGGDAQVTAPVLGTISAARVGITDEYKVTINLATVKISESGKSNTVKVTKDGQEFVAFAVSSS